MKYIIVVRLHGELIGMSCNGDMDDILEEFESIEDAENAMENHLLFNQPYQIVAIDV